MKKLLMAAGLALGLSACSSVTAPADTAPLAGTLKKPDLDRLVVAETGAPSGDFGAFLERAVRTYPALAPSVKAYESKATLAGAIW